MSGDFRANGGQGAFSDYLIALNRTWVESTPAPAQGRWLAISAVSCSNPARSNGAGCPDENKLSDGVVCDVSARLPGEFLNGPSQDFSSPHFFHGDSLLSPLCNNFGGLPALHSPGEGADVLDQLVRFIRGL